MHPAPPLAATGWSSSLSVAEHAAVREAGFTPRGLVMGSSVSTLGYSYSPAAYNQWGAGRYGGGGWQTGGWAGGGPGWAGGRPGGGWSGAGGSYSRWSRNFPGWVKYYSWSDLGWSGSWTGGAGLGAYYPMAAAVAWERLTYEDGIETAARLALERLEAETVALDAHGVVGVRLRFRHLEGLPSTIEFTALGTAVQRAGAAPLARPFTSHLDGQGLLKLIRAGLVPVVAAVGAGSVAAEWPRLSVGGPTMELRPHGDAIEMSRQIAADRIRRAAGTGGWAVVGTLASVNTSHEGEGEVSTTVLTGTVVRRFGASTLDRLPLPVMRLSRP